MIEYLKKAGLSRVAQIKVLSLMLIDDPDDFQVKERLDKLTRAHKRQRRPR
jgi:hypothetical protein